MQEYYFIIDRTTYASITAESKDIAITVINMLHRKGYQHLQLTKPKSGMAIWVLKQRS